MKILSQAELAELLSDRIFHLVGETADELGMECYVVGGYVRDLFLQRPSQDIDIVVVGSGIQMASHFAQRLGKGAHLSVFRNFGTAQVHWKGREVEFVGARRESYSRGSRKPVVEDGTLEDDQNRRDFTINAMAVCLNASRYGCLVDPFGGVRDLEERVISTPLDPDITFSDDPLRMMRCVRFATQLGFVIEQETFDALRRNADRLKIVSQERIIVELNKIMAAAYPGHGLLELYSAGLLELILPELVALDEVETRSGRAHKNNFHHTLQVLDNLSHEALPADSHELYLRWATLLHDIGKPRSKRWDPAQGWTFHNHNYLGARMVKGIFRRLKLPLDERQKYVEKLVELHMRPQAIADDGVTDSAVRRLLFEAGDDIDDLMKLCEADITSKNEQRKKALLANFRIVREKLADLQRRDYRRLLQPVIDGNEIMALFGLKPSPEVGTLKQTLKDAVLDGAVANEREPLMELLYTKARKMGLKAVATCLAALMLLPLASCGGEKKQSDARQHDEAEAALMLTQAREALAADSIARARNIIISMRRQCPLALTARRSGILLMDSIDMKAARLAGDTAQERFYARKLLYDKQQAARPEAGDGQAPTP